MHFKVNTKYKFRNRKGWAKFVAHVPEADHDQRTIFVDYNGDILCRYEGGNIMPSSDYDSDVLPIPYTLETQPCPFCGGNTSVFTCADIYVRCTDGCCMNGPSASTEEEAVKLWNQIRKVES